jgi:hypothetical protein
MMLTGMEHVSSCFRYVLQSVTIMYFCLAAYTAWAMIPLDWMI